MDGLGAIIAFLTGWLVSQLIKVFTEWIQLGKISGREIFDLLVKSRSGGMPSGHASSFVALTTYIGFSQGWNSSVFALAVGVAIIVIYDAINVRRSVGEIGMVLKKEKKLNRVVEGHTVSQVVMGGLLGVLMGWTVFLVVA